MEKQFEYAVKLGMAVATVFDENSDHYIKQSDFENDDNLKAFLHALANIVPNRMYETLTGEDKNTLEFNHIANHLVFEYSKVDNGIDNP